MAIRKERLQERAEQDDPDENEGVHFEPYEIEGSYFPTPEEACELFNREAQRLFGISGDELLRRWDSGEYGPIPDTPEGRKLDRMYGLISFVRSVPAGSGGASVSRGAGVGRQLRDDATPLHADTFRIAESPLPDRLCGRSRLPPCSVWWSARSAV